MRTAFVAAAFVAAALAVAAAAPAPSAPSSSPPSVSPQPAVSWQGVTLGESVDALVARLGPPRSRRKAIMGTYLLEYEVLDGAGTLSITDGNGAVTGIRLIVDGASTLRARVADPFGVALGDTADRLTELRGQPQRYDDEGGGEFTSYYGKASEVRWAYGLRDAVVRSISVISPYRVVRASGAVVAVPTPRPSNAPTPPPPDASEFDRAVRVTADDLAHDPQFEYDYIRAVACGGTSHFEPSGERMVNARHRNFRLIDAVCASSGEKRTFYFDVTAVFGRGER